MRPEHGRGRSGEERPRVVTGGDTQRVQRATDQGLDLDPFTWGVLAEAYNVARRNWWLKRAEDFEKAKPVPGEYYGNATREQLSERWRWCDEIVRACRAKAEMVGVDEELEQLLRDVA